MNESKVLPSDSASGQEIECGHTYKPRCWTRHAGNRPTVLLPGCAANWQRLHVSKDAAHRMPTVSVRRTPQRTFTADINCRQLFGPPNVRKLESSTKSRSGSPASNASSSPRVSLLQSKILPASSCATPQTYPNLVPGLARARARTWLRWRK